MAKAPSQIVQLRIELVGLKPPIWRRVHVPADFTLRRLHDVIQATFNWLSWHLYEFDVSGRKYGEPEFDDRGSGGDRLYSSKNIRLSKLIEWEVDQFAYVYDFGDDWVHLIIVEKILAPDSSVEYPVLINGELRAPPEDAGGPPGFFEFLQAMLDDSHPNHGNVIEWYGYELFDPDDMELETVEAQLSRIRAQRRKGPKEPKS